MELLYMLVGFVLGVICTACVGLAVLVAIGKKSKR